MIKRFLAAAALTAVACTSTTASADQIFSFIRITSNADPQAPDSQFTVTVLGPNDDTALAGYGGDILDNQALFVFKNNVGMASSITDVYFQDGMLLGLAGIRESAGVNFDAQASPANLPGGKTINPAFTTTPDFSADSNTAPNGVNSASEWVGILFDLKAGKTFTDVLNAINNWSYDASKPLADRWTLGLGQDGLRFGIHVQSIGAGGESDSYVSIPSDSETSQNFINPEPSSLALLGIGGVMGLFGAVRTRRQRATA